MGIIEKVKLMKLVERHFNMNYLSISKEYISSNKKNIKVTEKDSGISISLHLTKISVLAMLLNNNWKILDNSNPYIKLKGPNDEILFCRTQVGFDFGHLVEIYIKNVYGIDFKGKNIIDIGMSNGDSSIFFAKKGAKRVIGVEPDKRSFDLALKNITESKVDNIVLPLNRALSNQSGIIEMTVYNSNPNANSIDESNMVKLNDSKIKENIEAVELGEIIDMFNNENIDLLKMDCEGCEYKVLQNISEKYFPKISNIYLEYHHGLQDIPEIFNKHGFHVNIIEQGNMMGYIKANRDNA